MFITRGHFLSPYIRVVKDDKIIPMLHSVDTSLMVAVRLVGYDAKDNSPILDLAKIDRVFFVDDSIPQNIKDLIPEGFEIVKPESLDDRESLYEQE